MIIKDGTGDWIMKTANGTGNGEIIYQGHFKEGSKHGKWTMFYDDQLFVEEKYRKGKFKKGKLYDDKNNKSTKLSESILNKWIFHPVHLQRSEQLILDSLVRKSNFYKLRFRD